MGILKEYQKKDSLFERAERAARRKPTFSGTYEIIKIDRNTAKEKSLDKKSINSSCISMKFKE